LPKRPERWIPVTVTDYDAETDTYTAREDTFASDGTRYAKPNGRSFGPTQFAKILGIGSETDALATVPAQAWVRHAVTTASGDYWEVDAACKCTRGRSVGTVDVDCGGSNPFVCAQIPETVTVSVSGGVAGAVSGGGLPHDCVRGSTFDLNYLGTNYSIFGIDPNVYGPLWYNWYGPGHNPCCTAGFDILYFPCYSIPALQTWGAFVIRCFVRPSTFFPFGTTLYMYGRAYEYMPPTSNQNPTVSCSPFHLVYWEGNAVSEPTDPPLVFTLT
jgi:hypothetical protein